MEVFFRDLKNNNLKNKSVFTNADAEHKDDIKCWRYANRIY